ncbi:MAG: iron ABC transporter permease [Rhodospirillales bacterium]
MVTQATAYFRTKVLSRLTPWSAAVFMLAAVFLSPILAVFWAATGDSGGLWAHLSSSVLPRYIGNTLMLMGGVAVVCLLFGVSTAWTVVRYDFPGRRVFEWLLLLPAAMPAYLIAYVYTDFLEYAGPVQGFLREVFGWQRASDYWFPEIRSMEGAIMVMGAVLYPYVYVMSRTAFLLTPSSLFEAGMLSRRNVFWKVALPLARPAIAAGLALAMMETVSDFGTVEYFAIWTLTLGIFNVWLGMNSLAAAAQIASVAFLFIIALLALEILARARRRFSDTARRAVSLRPVTVKGRGITACWVVCATPILVGFVLPVGVLASFVIKGHSLDLNEKMVSATFNSVFLGGSVALVVMSVAAFMGFVAAYHSGPLLKRMTALASVGYAFPGTILAIGVVTAAGALDGAIAAVLGAVSDITFDGWFTSGVGLVIFACAVRFQAVGYGAVTTGLERLPPNMMSASRVLGHGFGASLGKVIMPLVSMSFVAGGLLVFVDVMKELPMTLLLRPFNYETLATYVYQYAKDELLEEAALPALFIVLSGVLPVMMMNAVLNRFTRQ